jgi:hypothetical protein
LALTTITEIKRSRITIDCALNSRYGLKFTVRDRRNRHSYASQLLPTLQLIHKHIHHTPQRSLDDIIHPDKYLFPKRNGLPRINGVAGIWQWGIRSDILLASTRYDIPNFSGWRSVKIMLLQVHRSTPREHGNIQPGTYVCPSVPGCTLICVAPIRSVGVVQFASPEEKQHVCAARGHSVPEADRSYHMEDRMA